MGLFGKNKRGENQNPAKSAEKNEIANTQLKEHLMNLALESLMAQGEDYHELAYTMCEFGYLFRIENHGLEALFKMKTDKGVLYFAVQGNSLMRLDFNEDLFQTTAEGFLSLHEQPDTRR